MSLKKWLPRRKIGFGLLASAFGALLIVFAPRVGLNLTDDEKEALKGFGYAVVVTLGTAYLVPGEPLKEEENNEPSSIES